MKAGSSVKPGSEQDSLLELCTCQVQGQEMMWEPVTSLGAHHTCTPPPAQGTQGTFGSGCHTQDHMVGTAYPFSFMGIHSFRNMTSLCSRRDRPLPLLS